MLLDVVDIDIQVSNVETGAAPTEAVSELLAVKLPGELVIETFEDVVSALAVARPLLITVSKIVTVVILGSIQPSNLFSTLAMMSGLFMPLATIACWQTSSGWRRYTSSKLEVLGSDMVRLNRHKHRFDYLEAEMAKQGRLKKAERELSMVAQNVRELGAHLKQYSEDITLNLAL